MQSICASHTSCAACVPCKAGAQFTCFTSIQVRILTRACRTELPLDLRCSVYWLYWYKGTNTDARLQSSTAARPLRAPALHCLGFFLFFLSSLPFFLFLFSFSRPLRAPALHCLGHPRRCSSLYLLYWYKSTNTDATLSPQPAWFCGCCNSGLKLLVYAALSYWCMRPYATGVCGLTLLYIYTAGGVLLWLLHLKMPSHAQTQELPASLLKWHYGLRLPKICPSHAARAWWSAVQVLSLLALLVQTYKY